MDDEIQTLDKSLTTYVIPINAIQNCKYRERRVEHFVISFANYMSKDSQVYTVKQAIEKAMKYCSYQERCQMEVRNKLRDFQITADEREEVIMELIQQNFLNEERFSKAFSRGKFRLKRWGRKKIELALRQKQISSNCISIGLTEIDSQEYHEVLQKLIERIWVKYQGIQNYKRVAKTAQYIIGRGFEPHLVWDELKQYSND